MSLELLSLGADFVGGLMGRSDARRANKQNLAMYDRQLRQSQGQFDAQMDQSVSRRVADAKRSGIHPLFALGASVGASPTISAGGAPAAQKSGMGDALTRMASTLGVIEQNRASARRDEAEAMLMDSERARIDQESITRGHDSTVKTYPYTGDQVQLGPATYYSPEVPLSKSTGIRAGTAPGTMDIKMPDGRTVNIYDPDLGLDEIGQLKYAYERAVHLGADGFAWLSKHMGRWFDRPISGHRLKLKKKYANPKHYRDGINAGKIRR